jgi:type VI secretion system protein ImpA
VGSSRAISPDDLRTTLLELSQVLTTHVARREPSTVEGADGQATDGTSAASGQEAARATGEIRSREDVVAALDRICQYYNRYEPSSPLPLLLARAKRLASKNFLEIVKDLTPDAVAQIQNLSGVSEGEE